MPNNILTQIGLSEKEAEIYEILLKLGKVPANKLLPLTELKRTTVYSVLEELATKGIIEKDEAGAIIQFRAKHPYALKEFMENQVARIKTAEGALDSALPDLVSSYNTVQNKPGVKFYEGLEGIKKILEDSLTSKTEVLTIVDVEAVDKYMKTINDEYVKKRNKKGIIKKILVLDTDYNKNFFENQLGQKDVKFCNLKISPFNTGIQIYDNKISYITMTEDFLTGTIIEDPYIYTMHKALFEFIWQKN